MHFDARRYRVDQAAFTRWIIDAAARSGHEHPQEFNAGKITLRDLDSSLKTIIDLGAHQAMPPHVLSSLRRTIGRRVEAALWLQANTKKDDEEGQQ